MNESLRTYTGANYVPTVALLVFAFVFSPTLLVLSGPAGAASYALAFSCVCLALARASWRRSTLSIASVVR